ncbi:hypothetical protein QZN00_13525 [Burkholderia multivorans]|nr:hypothetical protein [Burkholderia multivorans]
MEKNTPPPFSGTATSLTALCVVFVIIGCALYAIKTGSNEIYHYLIPVCLVVVAIGMKFSAPRLPWAQVGLLAVSIIAVHFVIEKLVPSFPPIFFVGDLAIQGICILGFGRFWVRKGYIRSSMNNWLE